jgi:hypothetical protein
MALIVIPDAVYPETAVGAVRVQQHSARQPRSGGASAPRSSQPVPRLWVPCAIRSIPGEEQPEHRHGDTWLELA